MNTSLTGRRSPASRQYIDTSTPAATRTLGALQRAVVQLRDWLDHDCASQRDRYLAEALDSNDRLLRERAWREHVVLRGSQPPAA